MTIGSLIKSRRTEKGLTLDDLSKMIGVTAATISRWESGKIESMRRSRIKKALSDALDIPVNVLMGWDTLEESKREISRHEMELLDAYRKAPEFARRMVLYALGLSQEGEKDGNSKV